MRMVRITACVRVLCHSRFIYFPLVRMFTNSLGVCSAYHKKSGAVQLLRGQFRISTNIVLEMLRKASTLIWKVNAGRDSSFTCLGACSIRTIRDGRIGLKVYVLYPFSETEK